jgi:hypothetical protein
MMVPFSIHLERYFAGRCGTKTAARMNVVSVGPQTTDYKPQTQAGITDRICGKYHLGCPKFVDTGNNSYSFAGSLYINNWMNYV